MNDTAPDYRLAKPRLPAANQGQLDDEYRNGLRDQIAMAAITGILAADPVGVTPDTLAHNSYVIADCMMEARKK